ncbi:MAG: type III secretion system chaperone [Puniceicoccales bacterium]|jgi:hypothetical protein|nr:type III secretion system chaperone [Puniceicoccales bacterium]
MLPNGLKMAMDWESGVAKLNGMLSAMGRELDLSDLKLDEKGNCPLSFGDAFMLRCSLDSTGEHVTFYACVGSLPAEAEAFWERLLVANYFWKESAGSRVGLDPEAGNSVTLTQSIPMEFLDDELFYKHVERFVNAMDYWEKRLAALQETKDRAAFLKLP